MEKAYKEGKVKAIGLSIFNEKQIQEILDICEVKPAGSSDRSASLFSGKEVEGVPWIKKASLSRHGILWAMGTKHCIRSRCSRELGKKYGKSNAQVILRWHIQAGNIVIPGSKNPGSYQGTISTCLTLR